MIHSSGKPRHTPASAITMLLRAAMLILPACGTEADDTTSRTPSVLLVTLDTTRADAWGCLSDGAGRTPVLDALSRQGTLYSEARTVAPLTLPAHASLMTGDWPFQHGARDNGFFQVRDEEVTLAERFGEAGYRTGAVVASPVLDSRYGLDQGFEVYDDDIEPGLIAYRTADQVVDAARDHLRRLAGDDRPFFFWAHFFDPHRPLRPPESYAREELARLTTTDPLEREKALYRAEVAFLDHELGRLLDEARALAGDHLILAITSDHGEGNGDHGELAHGYFLFDTTLRIPLLLAGPGVPKGRRDDTPVTLVDLPPTLLELAGLDPQPGAGRSLVQGWQESAAPAPGRTIYFETCYPYTNHRWSPAYGLLAGRYKLIDSARALLFDLDQDPRETDNILARHQDQVTSLRQYLTEWSAETSTPQLRTLTPEQRERLQAIGYLARPPTVDRPDVFRPGFRDETLTDPSDCQALIRAHGRAFQRFANGDANGAADEMLAILAQDPDNPHYLDQAGTFLCKAGRFEDAARILDKATRLDPNLATSWRNLADACKQLRRFDDAITALEHHLALAPEAWRARLELAQLIDIHQGRRQHAIELMESCLPHMDPDAELTGQVKERLKILKGDS